MGTTYESNFRDEIIFESFPGNENVKYHPFSDEGELFEMESKRFLISV